MSKSTKTLLHEAISSYSAGGVLMLEAQTPNYSKHNDIALSPISGCNNTNDGFVREGK